MKINLFLIRHGKTQGNLNYQYIGKTDQGLCDVGIKELTLNCEKNLYPQTDFLYTSGLIRCIETANIIYPIKMPTIKNGLRECDFGDFEEKNYEQLKYKLDYQHFLNSNGTARFPNGESTSEFAKRCVDAFDDILNGHNEGETIVIICHGGTIMAILDKYSNPHEDFYIWQVKNTEGYSFKFDTDLKLATDINKIQGE